MIAKLSIPTVGEHLRRERLDALFESALDGARALWVEAPGGYGKSAAAAAFAADRCCLWYQLDAGDDDPATFFHFLSEAASSIARCPPRWVLGPEYLPGADTFSRRVFEQLGELLRPAPALLVLDNEESLAADSPLHALLAAGLDALGPGLTTMILSRRAMAPAFARLRVGQRIRVIDAEPLQFTVDETLELLRRHHPDSSPPQLEAVARQICAQTRGWAAASVLAIERAIHCEESVVVPGEDAALFDYFASEYFDRADEPLRAFLLATACLPSMTAELAARVSDRQDAEQVLEHLVKANFFTSRRAGAVPSYEYHPLLAAFLQARARAVDPMAADQARRRCAALLAELQRLEGAAELLVEAADWPTLISLICEHAPHLIEQGRHASVVRWLGPIPRGTIERVPGALFWLGVSQLPFCPADARHTLQLAFERFDEQQPLERIRTWAAIGQSFVIERDRMADLDAWIDAWPQLSSGIELPPALAAQVIPPLFGALVHRRPASPSLPALAALTDELFTLEGDPNTKVAIGLHLVNYYHWLGDLPRTRFVTEALRVVAHDESGLLSPLALLTHHAAEAIYAWMTGTPQQALTELAAGLELSRSSGLHVLDHVLWAQGVFAALALGDLPTARSHLDRLLHVQQGGRAMERAHTHLAALAVELAAGDAAQARLHGEAARTAARHAGMPFPLALTRVVSAIGQVLAGELAAAEQAIDQANATGQAMGSRLLAFECDLLRVLLALERGDERGATGALRKVFALGSKAGLQLAPWWPPAIKARLCQLALDQAIEPGYARSQARQLSRVSSHATGAELWPARVDVRAMGGFDVHVAGDDVAAGERPQQRPFTLFKCLVALGGAGVDERRVADRLWPDSDGDRATAALKTTLARLRRLIGAKTVRLQGRRLSLDTTRCRVDALLLDEALSSGTNSATGRRLLELYRGPFLPDDDAWWVIARREQLESRTTALLRRCAETARAEGDVEQAVVLLAGCIEIAPHSSESVQQLAACYRQVGREAEAAQMFADRARG